MAQCFVITAWLVYVLWGDSVEFLVTKCDECPGITKIPGLEVNSQGYCQVLKEAVYFGTMDQNCPFPSGGGTSYKKGARVGG